MKRSLTLLLRIFVRRRRWGLGNRTVRHLAQCGGMWRCLSSTAQVVQMALALALMPTCANADALRGMKSAAAQHA